MNWNSGLIQSRKQIPKNIIISSKILERALVAAILFYCSLAFCLPIPPSETVGLAYPWYAVRIDIGKVVLHELIFIAWLTLFGYRFVLRSFFNRGIPTRQAAIWLIALAIWCGLVSLTAPLPLQDLGRTFRLFLNIMLMFSVVRWTVRLGNFTLSVFVLGFLVGTVINLVITYKFPNTMFANDVMRLSGQNTAGVAMGVAIHLSAWLFYKSNLRRIQALALITCIVCGFGCGISYSRTGWVAGAFGMMVWAYILIFARPSGVIKRFILKRDRRMWIPLIAIGVVVLLSSSMGKKNLLNIQTLMSQKVFSEDRDKRGDAYRAAYFVGVGEILLKHPFGVGYSGFLDAMRSTQVYKSGKASKEDSYEANPHSSFLYYTSAGGVPGAFMALTIFVLLLNSMRCGLVSTMSRSGLVLFAFISIPFLVIGLSVPYIFNSAILIIPTAIAAGWGLELHLERQNPEIATA